MCNVLIADEHSVCRIGIDAILKKKINGINIFFSNTITDAIRILKSEKIDLLIFDINTSKENSKLLISSFKKISPAIKILIFTNQDERIHALRYISAGANGFIEKTASEEVFVFAVSEIIKVGVYVSDRMKDSVYKFAVRRKVYNPLESLSEREFEVAKLLIQGKGNIEIMNQLNIKMSTVSTFKNRIFEKLGIDNVVSLFDIFKVYEEFN